MEKSRAIRVCFILLSSLLLNSFTRAKLDEVNNDNSQRGDFKAMATGVEKVLFFIILFLKFCRYN